MTKIRVYHFVNNNVGGVFSVVKNLLRFTQLREMENHLIFTINKSLHPGFNMPVVAGASTQRIFYYSPKWNFYHTCKQLASLLPDDKALVVAHDWLELGMMSNLGLQNPVVQVVHGNYDYYYNLAIKHQACIDAYICVSPVIQRKLSALLPEPKRTSVHYLRFPVPAVNSNLQTNEKLKIVYASGNLIDENKQFSLVPEINSLLQKENINVDWIIVGKGKTKEELLELMYSTNEVMHAAYLDNEALLALLPTADIFLLPSLKEGFPVAVVEAMKAGLVPLVTDWQGATAELIIEGKTGFYVKPKDAEGYAKRIAILNDNRSMLDEICAAAKRKADELFDPAMNTRKVEVEFTNMFTMRRPEKVAVKAYGSRLDGKGIPNLLTKTLRSLK